MDTEDYQSVNGRLSGAYITPPEDRVELRLRLLDNGYQPIPVVNINHNGPSPGKRPRIEAWQTIDITEPIIRSWDQGWIARDTNTGIRAGSVVGFDTDVLDAGLSGQLQKLTLGLLGHTPLYRVGLAPKCLMLYRNDTPIPKKTTEKFYPADMALDDIEDKELDFKPYQIEILGQGNQFVSFGLHPDAKQPYQWLHASPLDVPLSELPLITTGQIL